MRERRAWRLEKPYGLVSTSARHPEQGVSQYLLGLWREELQGKVGGIFGQGGNLVRNALHVGYVTLSLADWHCIF